MFQLFLYEITLDSLLSGVCVHHILSTGEVEKWQVTRKRKKSGTGQVDVDYVRGVSARQDHALKELYSTIHKAV